MAEARLWMSRARRAISATTTCTAVEEGGRYGLLTPATKALVGGCERRVAECEAAMHAQDGTPAAPVMLLPTVVARYLSDLRATLNTDGEAARALLARLVGQ